MNKNESYLLGVMLGDGYLNYNPCNRTYNICMKTKDSEFAERFVTELNISVSKKIFMFKEKNESCKQGFHYKCLLINKEKYTYFKKELINYENLVKRESKPVIIAFLEGMYDSEGCVTDKKYSNRIIFNNRKKELINFVKLLLNKLGIESHVYSTLNKGKPYYELYVCTNKEISKFAKLIKFTIPRKQKRLMKIVNSNRS